MKGNAWKSIAPMALLLLLVSGFVTWMGCDDGDDDDASGTPTTETTPTPADETEPPGTPTPTPEPFQIEDGHYALYGPYYFTLDGSSDVDGYVIAIEMAYAYFEDNQIVNGNQYFMFWKSETAYTEGADPDCVMPETFEGTYKAGFKTIQCRQCAGFWDMAFYPIEEETTCSDVVVAAWNGEDAMFDPWFDTWGLAPTPEGYPSDFPQSFIDQLDSMDAKFVTYSQIFGWAPDYVGIPYCNWEPDAEECQ